MAVNQPYLSHLQQKMCFYVPLLSCQTEPYLNLGDNAHALSHGAMLERNAFTSLVIVVFRPSPSCLSDPIDVFDRAQYMEFVSNYPGQEYSPNEQCQDILGLDSYYGWVGTFLTHIVVRKHYISPVDRDQGRELWLRE